MLSKVKLLRRNRATPTMPKQEFGESKGARGEKKKGELRGAIMIAGPLGQSGNDEICNVITLFISSRGFFEDLKCFSMIFWM